MKKYTKSEIEGMIKSLEAKEKKARSKWGKAVLQDAQWLLENVIEGCDEPYELSEKLLLNGAENWNEFSSGGSGLIYDAEIAEHYSTPSELKNFLTKDGGVKRYTNSAGEHLLDIQARALRQAWWAIRDEMKGTTEFSMSLCEFSGEGKEQGYYEENEDEDDENFSIVDDTKDVLKETGKLAGNIVKNTTDKGGILMF